MSYNDPSMQEVFGEFPVEYCAPEDFVAKTRELNAEIVVYEGKFRWIVTREDGSQYFIRPTEPKPAE